MGLVIGTVGCVSQKPVAVAPPVPNVQRALGEGQVMVESRLVQGGKTLSAPKIITMSGREAQIFVGQEQKVAGAAEPVETGIKLTILPVLKDGKVTFTGSCSMKEKWNVIGDVRTTSTSFVTREAIFSGTAASGEVAFLFLPGNINGDESIEVTLKFTLAGKVATEDGGGTVVDGATPGNPSGFFPHLAKLENDQFVPHPTYISRPTNHCPSGFFPYPGTLADAQGFPTNTTFHTLSPKQATEIQKEMVLVALKELLKTTHEELLQEDLGVKEKAELRDNLESIRGRIDLWSR